MATEFYSSAETVKNRTGADPGDLGLADEPALETFIEELLTEISDLMNVRMKRDYLAEFDAGTITKIPAGLHGIAADIAADSIREMVATRQTPVVRIDDFAVRVVQSRIFTDDVTKRLGLYARSLGSVDVIPGHIAAYSDDDPIAEIQAE